VDTSRFSLGTRDDGYFLIVSALVPYKRVDLAVEAFNRIGERLIVVGSGPEYARLRGLAGPTVEFVGWRSEAEVGEYYARCRGVVFPGEEDFGIVPLEAMACGKAVVAYARGGALETVRDAPGMRTGILFGDQTVDSLLEAVGRFRTTEFNPVAMRAFALTFDRELYKNRMQEYVLKRWGEFLGQSPQVHI
jgi:glycosyltransferase involved in cell wall biosynthesis